MKVLRTRVAVAPAEIQRSESQPQIGDDKAANRNVAPPIFDMASAEK
jgi:hypothetical protein